MSEYRLVIGHTDVINRGVNLNINPRMNKTTFIIVFSLAMQAITVKQIRKNEVLKFLIVINPLDLILTKSQSGVCQ